MTENEECMYEKFGVCDSLMMNTCMYEKVPMRKLAESFMLTVCVRYQHNSDAVGGNIAIKQECHTLAKLGRCER